MCLRRPNVILDMRQNGGGNFLLTRDLMIRWPKKLGPTGRLFVLEGPETFSAAIASIAFLKQTGGSQVILAGAPPGDRMTFFSEGSNARPGHPRALSIEDYPSGRDPAMVALKGWLATHSHPGD